MMTKKGHVWAGCLASALLGVRVASASEFAITADSFTVVNQLNVSSATFYGARSVPPPTPESATQLTTPGGMYFDGTYYNVWDRNALAWVRLATGTVSGSVAASSVTPGTLGASVIASSVAASAVGTVQVANNTIKHEDMARGADTAVAGSAADVALNLNADLLDGLDSSGFAAASSGVCYTSWGGSTCAGGWSQVYSGRMLTKIIWDVSIAGQPIPGNTLCIRTDSDVLANGRAMLNSPSSALRAMWASDGDVGTSQSPRVVLGQGNAIDTNLLGAISCAMCCK